MKRLLAFELARGELRHAVDHQRVVGVGEPQIVARAERRLAELGKGKPRRAHRGAAAP